MTERKLADKETLAMIRYVVARGFVVTGHGYRYSIVNGWFNIEKCDL